MGQDEKAIEDAVATLRKSYSGRIALERLPGLLLELSHEEQVAVWTLLAAGWSGHQVLGHIRGGE